MKQTLTEELFHTFIFPQRRLLWSEMPRPEESDSDDEGEMGGDEDGEGHQFSADVEATGAREVRDHLHLWQMCMRCSRLGVL